ncbi:HNH endonuclease [Georgenia muralis]|uniref:HNH endonuclease n=1 Tax=Georgenia muralis TaxID=154117 RepID=A0A3N4ZA86_9MICO|nr:HNH endonuclease signature motif containing protein [Georgenia muralis]RPF29033.1 HNH endonuclease [Georgenia muralis]
MTSWVLTIAEDYPNHWEIAKENGLWDMTTHRPIERADRVYFWVTGGMGFVGRVLVTRGAHALADNAVLPWTDQGKREYVSRFEFAQAEDYGAEPVSWTAVAKVTGWARRPDYASATPRQDSAAETWLSSLFTTTEDDAERAFATAESAAAKLADLKEDTRERALAEIAVRRGQGKFRTSLLAAYGRRCAVTGTTEEAVLEAAHISPYRGTHTNLVANGLLLRSDIHTLFDLHLLTVRPHDGSYVVRVAPSVAEQHYRDLDGHPLQHLPHDVTARPSAEALANHNQGCAWLTGRIGPTVDYAR